MLRKGLIIFGSLIILANISNKAVAQAKKLKTIVVDAGHGGSDPGATGQYENSLKSKEKDITLAISLKLVAELKKKLPELKIVPTRTTDVFDNVKVKADIANEAKGDLFICIHADSGPAGKKVRKQVGTKTVTKTKVTYTGKGKNRERHEEQYDVEVPVYETFTSAGNANGTSIYIFAAGKTSMKEDAIMDDTNSEDSAYNNFNFNTPEGRQLAQIYAKAYQEKSDRIASLVSDEIEKTGRKSLGVKQRQKGIWVLSATKMPAILIETGYVNNPDDERYINSEKGQQELVESITKAVIKYKAQIEKPVVIATPTPPSK
jgi:N-acetylmuramoyl-L-alanine amidase